LQAKYSCKNRKDKVNKGKPFKAVLVSSGFKMGAKKSLFVKKCHMYDFFTTNNLVAFKNEKNIFYFYGNFITR
jgi:hypothetical protein